MNILYEQDNWVIWEPGGGKVACLGHHHPPFYIYYPAHSGIALVCSDCGQKIPKTVLSTYRMLTMLKDPINLLPTPTPGCMIVNKDSM